MGTVERPEPEPEPEPERFPGFRDYPPTSPNSRH